MDETGATRDVPFDVDHGAVARLNGGQQSLLS